MKIGQVLNDNQTKKSLEVFNGPYWEDFCPVCDGKAVSGCRCMINDRECKDGHTWHRVGGKVVMGSGH